MISIILIVVASILLGTSVALMITVVGGSAIGAKSQEDAGRRDAEIIQWPIRQGRASLGVPAESGSGHPSATSAIRSYPDRFSLPSGFVTVDSYSVPSEDDEGTGGAYESDVIGIW
jgi:hypothetical protein